MATLPRINYPDNTGTTTNLVLTSNIFNHIFNGEVDSNIIDVQININGSGFISDPNLVELSFPNFTIPNLNVYPNGLELERGKNTIELRSIDISGAISPTSVITIDVVPTPELGIIYAPPTGIRLQRNQQSVSIEWILSKEEFSDQIPLIGYNLYASTGPGGSGSGYLKINQNLISVSNPTETVAVPVSVSSITQEFSNPDPRDPLTYSLSGEAVGADVVVTAKTVRPVTNELISDEFSGKVELGVADKYTITITVNNIYENKYYSFSHDRDDGLINGILNSDIFSIVNPEDPLYYVLTSVYFDKATGKQQESRYSSELTGAPLPLDTTIRGIRIREQNIIVQDYISEIDKTNPELSLIPGSTVREIHIEPFSNEIQKAYFLMDFVHRSKSFEALLQIDDPNKTGVSILVANSAYKQNLKAALALSSDVAVQSLIDGSFDSLAANFNIPRQGRRSSVVNQTFYTTNLPTKDLIIQQNAIVSSSKNSSAPRFRASGSYVLSAANAQSYYNPVTRRYEIKVQLSAEVPGSIGNVPAGDLDTVASGAVGFQTINEVAASFGRDKQSNLKLAESASRALVSLDTGTSYGYLKTALSLPGIIEARVIESGSLFMMRDYDEIRKKHIGGKVDVWIKGVIERTVIESFAFQFNVARNIRFDVIDATNLIFQARDSRLSEDNPIAEMLYNPSQGFGFRNQSNSPVGNYDLTGVSIINYNTIRLNSSIPQPSTLVDDFIEGDYRFRSNNKFVANYQPIRRIVSVMGEVSGPLDTTDGYTLFKTEDPLLLGESTLANDYIEINQVDGVPAGNTISVNDEKHTMIGQFDEALFSVGINTLTIRVFNEDRSVEYSGPNYVNPDYLIIGGSQTESVSIRRSANSNIENGSIISVDYDKDENFQVTYVINDILQRLQNNYESMRHVTADIVAKQSIENPLLTEASVQLKPNILKSTVDPDIRTNITILTDAKSVGSAIRISDMVATIDNTGGVDFVVQPFSRFTLSSGSLRIRDSITSNYLFVPSLSHYTNAVYLLTQPLPFDTMDGGSLSTIHKGVFKDELIMEMASSLDNVGFGLNRSWIIGRLGTTIIGYSDDETLTEAGFITSDEIAAERINRTANRVVISLDAGQNPADTPDLHMFSASYTVDNDRGVKDVETSLIEYLTPGNITITYRQV